MLARCGNKAIDLRSNRPLRLTLRPIGRMVRGLLLETGCHETKMTWQTLHNNGANSTRPGTATRVRNRYLGSVARFARCSGVPMYGIGESSQGDRKP
jgi:hypothetical protein